MCNWFDMTCQDLITEVLRGGFTILKTRPFESREAKGPIFWFMATNAPFSQTRFRDTLPVFYYRVVLRGISNRNPIFPTIPLLLHQQYDPMAGHDLNELVEYLDKNFSGFQKQNYLRNLTELESGHDWWSEGAINKMDEVVFVNFADRAWIDFDDNVVQHWKLKPRIVQSSHPKVTCQVIKFVNKACARLLFDWEEPFMISGRRVKFFFATKVSQHELQDMIKAALETYDYIVFVSGDDTLIFVMCEGQWWCLESDASHFDASQRAEAMEHLYMYLATLGMPKYVLDLFRRQDSCPRWYSYDYEQFYISAGLAKTTGSCTTSIGNSINIAIVAYLAFLNCGNALDLLNRYKAAAVQCGYVVKAFYAPWDERCPTFLKNLVLPGGDLVVEPGMVSRFCKVLTDPRTIYRTKDITLACRYTAYSFAQGIQFFHRELVMDVWMRMLFRIGLKNSVRVKTDSYMIENMRSDLKGTVRHSYDVYAERYQCTRSEIDSCVKLLDSVDQICSVISHPVLLKMGIIAYG